MWFTSSELRRKQLRQYRNMASNDIYETCIFCLISNDQDKETQVIKKNEELVCFRDIYPAAPHHYLVVPIQHIHSCLSLHSGHIGLVKRMAEMGKTVLHEQGVTDMEDIRLGFHQPPFTSVNHLHLHVLAPSSQIFKHMQYKFLPGTLRFVTEAYLQKHLKDNAPLVISEESLNQNEPRGNDASCFPGWNTTSMTSF
ncbi:LOW QUALITY PROTEIN: histidine triad nucleotide-binding protein 3-like [Etheostoma cragini]|uniref:LOW QUALITY PROTEIN: histidine triad nucleotide-binding protein 3-like n=1 Tax=Etheostoma cragini TaxID=417921 RepID=UPI00155E0F89|nr:LOW QUALITY PROTEIN: histidine triad nucleotide-binding protein 3-like [Etheostoma cragini]